MVGEKYQDTNGLNSGMMYHVQDRQRKREQMHQDFAKKYKRPPRLDYTKSIFKPKEEEEEEQYWNTMKVRH